jgi:hypothetical protein
MGSGESRVLSGARGVGGGVSVTVFSVWRACFVDTVLCRRPSAQEALHRR